MDVLQWTFRKAQRVNEMSKLKENCAPRMSTRMSLSIETLIILNMDRLQKATVNARRRPAADDAEPYCVSVRLGRNCTSNEKVSHVDPDQDLQDTL